MSERYKVKIPKGTTIDINGNSFLLKKSIYAENDGDKIILTGDKITTDLFTIEKKHISSSNISNDLIPNDLHKTAFKIINENLKDVELRDNAFLYLKQIFKKAVEIDDKPNAPKPNGPLR